MMWTAIRHTIADPAGEIVTLAANDRVLGVIDVVRLWRNDAAFRDLFIATLAVSPYPAFFWEMPPVDNTALDRTFECALIRSGALARMHADDADFAEQLRGTEPVFAFPNLSGDALLIAPRKIADADCYGHIAAFLCHAPRDQQHALLRCLAFEIEKRLATSRERFWVSTSGLGVPWVHVRVDRRPKYFQYDRYKA